LRKAEGKANEYHQGNSNYLLPLIVASIKSLMNGIKLQCGLDEPMVSVMAIGSEVFGSCVGGIDVSVGMENRGVWLSCG
jgi:hypothetical protein